MTSALSPAQPAKSIAAPFMALVGGALAMGASPIFVRLADVGPFTSAFWRVALALPILYAWMRIVERNGAPSRAFSRATLLSGIAFAGDLFFWHLSIVTTTVANATFFATTAPVTVILISWLLFRTRVSASVLAGVGLCIFGGAALLAHSLRLQTSGALGDLFALVTSVFFGVYFLTMQAARRDSSAARATFEATLITAALLLIVALACEHRFWPQSLSGLAALLGMAWISHAGGQGLLAIALGRLPATFSSLVTFLQAIAAACLAWAILGEPLTPIQALAGLVILSGIYVARPR